MSNTYFTFTSSSSFSSEECLAAFLEEAGRGVNPLAHFMVEKEDGEVGKGLPIFENFSNPEEVGADDELIGPTEGLDEERLLEEALPLEEHANAWAAKAVQYQRLYKALVAGGNAAAEKRRELITRWNAFLEGDVFQGLSGLLKKQAWSDYKAHLAQATVDLEVLDKRLKAGKALVEKTWEKSKRNRAGFQSLMDEGGTEAWKAYYAFKAEVEGGMQCMPYWTVTGNPVHGDQEILTLEEHQGFSREAELLMLEKEEIFLSKLGLRDEEAELVRKDGSELSVLLKEVFGG